MSERLTTVLGHTETALSGLRGMTSPGHAAAVVAECWRAFLGPNELRFMALAALMAVDGDYRNAICASVDTERRRQLRDKADELIFRALLADDTDEAERIERLWMEADE